MAMELEHSFTVPVPPEQAWDVLLDVQRVAPCMPGATVDSVEGDDVTGRLRVKVGPVSLTYRGTARFTDRDTTNRSVVVEASGKETRGAGTASATVRAALHPQDEAGSDGGKHTLVTLHTTLNVTGRPAQFGRGVMAEVGGKLVGQFADNLAKQLSGGPGGSGGSADSGGSATAGGPAGAPGQAEVRSGESTAGTTATGTTAGGSAGSAETASATGAAGAVGAAASVGAAPPQTAPGGAPSAAASQEPSQNDAINLLSVAGPAVLKRAAPAAGIAAALGLIIWWVLRLVRHRNSA